MGKKAKTGKARKDKFYQLAKETGYRARSAFKLLQLNRKFQFLEKSRVCVDLCAAPGGWMQVAANQMPVQKLVIGVDLVPIKPVPDCISFQGDITTEKCRQKIKELLNEWRVDVFLHDGAPNVGMNWLHDAFQQAQLTLSALKLSTQFLKKGGWFVTKVFRSKDYQSLMWVFQQLFRKVHATKPLASRNESAEIFVVCQGYHAPDKLDPKFLDPKYVFKDTDVDTLKSQSLNLVHPEKISKKAEGYAEGDNTLYHKLRASHFIGATNHLELLAQASEILIDSDDILKHPKTTPEIRECCKDIKVLGKKEIRGLITWHKAMKKYLTDLTEKRAKEEAMDTAEQSDSEEESDYDEEEEKELSEKLANLKEEEKKELKKKRKKVMKAKRQLRDKMSLNMVIPGDTIEQVDDIDIFSLKKITSGGALKRVEGQNIEDAAQGVEEDSEEDEEVRKIMVKYDRHKAEEQGDAMGPESDEDEEEDEPDMEFETDSDDDDDDDENETTEEKNTKNPLVVEMEDQNIAAQRKSEMWFNKVNDLLTENLDEKDDEAETPTEQAPSKKRQREMESSDSEDDDDDDDDDEEDEDSEDDDSDDEDFFKAAKDQANGKPQQTDKTARKDGFEIVPVEEPRKKVRKLDPIGLAIGEELIKSRKRRRELEEMSFHRYTFNDDNLPDWFAKEETGHMKKPLPVSKEQIDYYKEKQKAIDARPIKKIAEAKARKQRKTQKKLERARKKAEAISDTVDTTDKEKWNKIKEVYKRAGLTKKKNESVSYVVAKRGAGKRVSRPAGVKGRFKVVDPRMKKDDKARKTTEKKNKKKGRGKSSTNRTRR